MMESTTHTTPRDRELGNGILGAVGQIREQLDELEIAVSSVPEVLAPVLRTDRSPTTTGVNESSPEPERLESALSGDLAGVSRRLRQLTSRLRQTLNQVDL